MSRFIALHCGDESTALLANHPNAFLLLTQIAMRAKWRDCPITRLKAGQAFIGDWKEAGLHSEKSYRHAKEILSNCGLAAFRGASKGTIATLVDSRIFSITAEGRGGQAGGQTDSLGADKGRARGGQGATNHTDTQSTQTPLALNGASSCPSPTVISWNPSDGFSGITESDMLKWREAFPAVDIKSQLLRASLWLENNPAKRKKMVGRFITGWLSRQQEKGGDIASNPVPQAPAGTVMVNGRAFKS